MRRSLKGQLMRYLRLYAGVDGESHFEDTDVALAPVEFIPGRPRVDLSPPSAATGTAFIRLPAGWDSGGRYNPPRRNFFVTLSGELEIEASDGQVRQLGPGAVLLAEDTTGKGHVTRSRGGEWVGMLVTPADASTS
jgi:hypothetical protein